MSSNSKEKAEVAKKRGGMKDLGMKQISNVGRRAERTSMCDVSMYVCIMVMCGKFMLGRFDWPKTPIENGQCRKKLSWHLLWGVRRLIGT